jgi:predicted DNA-binding transcriptional regulator AlpA
MHSNTSVSAFSIQQFCDSHGISRGKYYLLLQEGLAPKIMKIGRRTLISIEAAEAWRREMERLALSKEGK